MRIDCPSCSAQIAVTPLDRYARCDYCHSFLRIDLGESLAKTTYQVTVTPGRIPSILKRALIGHDLNREFQIRKIDLEYYPFWRFQWKQTTRFAVAASEVDKKLGEYTFRTGTQEFFHPESIENARIIEPDIFLENALENLDDLPEDTAGEEMVPALIYAPFYRVIFTYGTSDYHAWVSGAQAQVIFQDVPASPALVMNQSFAVTAALIFLAYGAVTFLAVQFTHSLPAALTANVGLTFLLHAWLKKVLLR